MLLKQTIAAAIAIGLWTSAAGQENSLTPTGVLPTQTSDVSGLPGVEPVSVKSSEATRWEVRTSDITLSKTIERWTTAAGHKLKWDAGRDFLIGAPDVYQGTFEGALQHLLSSPGIRYSDSPLEACIYANTPLLVRITRLGEQSRECVAVSGH